MKDLLVQVKAAGQDFEWYPTTRKMLEVVAQDLKTEFDTSYGDGNRRFSILDIGAGDGNALRTIRELTRNEGQMYAIEKSKVLVDSLPADVFVIGTDFYQQTLIDKQVDVIFCNPPYSDFVTWMHRIVAEANCRLIYMVVPQRWKDKGFITEMINRRCDIKETEDRTWPESVRRTYLRERGVCEVLDSASFEDSEFREARAEVDIVKIRLRVDRHRDNRPIIDPFDLWFDSTFRINADRVKPQEFGSAGEKRASLHELVKGQNVIERLEELYRADFERLLGIYRDLEKLDYELFKELGVDLTQVREGLKSKIKGLKNLYWQELFANLDAITDRLTSKSRKALLDKLTAHTSIDFTADNAYAVVVWAIKNANAYFDQQLLEVYLALADQENVRNYKSNHMVVDDNWRFTRKEQTHYTLDYRLVINRWRCFNPLTYGDYDYPNGLHRDTHETLNDLCTIAENLGFAIETDSLHLKWEPGKLQEFRMVDGRLFMDVRAFKKGTIHVRLDQDFMRRLNVEAGRLNGWVKSPAEAREEMGIDNAAELYGSNFKLKSVPMLAAPEPQEQKAAGQLPLF